MNLQERQLFCMEYLIEHLDWDDYQCAALVGCMTAESYLNPHFINKEEKNGTSFSGACNKKTEYGTKNSPWGYGAGIVQWTYTDRKENALQLGLGIQNDKAIAMIKSGGVESLPLEQQLKMVVAEITKGIYKDNFEIVIKKCNTLKDAVATVYCRYIGGYSSKITIPTDSDIKRLDKIYNTINPKIISGFEIRLKYTDKILDLYHKSIDL